MRFYLSPRPLLGLSALLMMLACNRAPPPAVDATPPPVSVAAAIEREITLTDEFPGQIEALETVAIQARVNGYLQSIHFKPGTEIKRGDLLFVIDPRPFAARLVKVEATLANSHAQLALAKAELKRQTDMLETHATSEREFEAATAAVQSLEAGIRGNQASIASARLDLEYTRITAPIDGRVGKDEVTVGNLVQGDSGSPVLTTLVSVDPVYVSFEADEHAYLKYLSGTRSERLSVEVGLADETDFPHQATLDFVDNQLSTTSGTVRLRAVMMNPDRRFTPGLFARVRLHSATKSAPVVLVAERAIGTDQSKRFVLTVGVDKIANYREVRIGRQVGNLRVIESGLALGEVIVVSGLQRVRPGAPVTPELVPMDAGKALASP